MLCYSFLRPLSWFLFQICWRRSLEILLLLCLYSILTLSCLMKVMLQDKATQLFFIYFDWCFRINEGDDSRNCYSFLLSLTWLLFQFYCKWYCRMLLLISSSSIFTTVSGLLKVMLQDPVAHIFFFLFHYVVTYHITIAVSNWSYSTGWLMAILPFSRKW